MSRLFAPRVMAAELTARRNRGPPGAARAGLGGRLGTAACPSTRGSDLHSPTVCVAALAAQKPSRPRRVRQGHRRTPTVAEGEDLQWRTDIAPGATRCRPHERGGACTTTAGQADDRQRSTNADEGCGRRPAVHAVGDLDRCPVGGGRAPARPEHIGAIEHAPRPYRFVVLPITASPRASRSSTGTARTSPPSVSG